MKATRVSWTAKKIELGMADIIAVPFRQEGENPAYEFLNGSLNGELAVLVREQNFRGQTSKNLVWQGMVRGKPARVILFGVGKSERSPDTWRRQVAEASRIGARLQAKSFVLIVDGKEDERLEAQIRWSTEALVLSDYDFVRYKSPKNHRARIGKFSIGVYSGERNKADFRREMRKANAIAQGVLLARDLVNEPANILNPGKLADAASELAADKGFRCTLYHEKDLIKKGMNLILAVAGGSKHESKLIHLVYRPEKKAKGKIVLVGKGITFDSGGLCVKPPKSMYTMKTDMAGAAAVLGIMSTLDVLAPPLEIHAVIPATENAVGSNAVRPGDVITGLNGLTVEILNTDAEGRLILADALTFAAQLSPNLIIDYATLTGACAVALGPYTAGLFSNSKRFGNHYLKAAERVGESCWRLPLIDELAKELASEVADLKNIGGRYGGAITAALFLRRFVDKKPWIHIDIAGPARAERNTDLCPKGGSGFGVLSGVEFLACADQFLR